MAVPVAGIEAAVVPAVGTVVAVPVAGIEVAAAPVVEALRIQDSACRRSGISAYPS